MYPFHSFTRTMSVQSDQRMNMIAQLSKLRDKLATHLHNYLSNHQIVQSGCRLLFDALEHMDSRSLQDGGEGGDASVALRLFHGELRALLPGLVQPKPKQLDLGKLVEKLSESAIRELLTLFEEEDPQLVLLKQIADTLARIDASQREMVAGISKIAETLEKAGTGTTCVGSSCLHREEDANKDSTVVDPFVGLFRSSSDDPLTHSQYICRDSPPLPALITKPYSEQMADALLSPPNR